MAGMMKAKSFDDRKRALDSFADLCGRPDLLSPDGDALICRAFGVEGPQLDLDMVWEAVTAARSAAGPDQLAKGVPDPVAQALRSVKVADLRSWDSSVGSHFKGEMDTLYTEADPVLLKLVKAEGVVGKEADTLARLLQAIVLTESPQARRFAIAGLAVRAGIINENRLRDAVEGADTRALDALCKEAAERYDGSLDGFINIYRHYHGVTAVRRPSAGLNDCLDLDPLLYFREGDPEFCYVTGEDFWLEVVNLAFAGRAIDVKPIARRPAQEADAE
jgi:hypothetical protein